MSLSGVSIFTDWPSSLVRSSRLCPAPKTGCGQHAVAQARSCAGGREVAATVLAEQALQMTRHPDSRAGADLAGDLDVSIASVWVKLMSIGGKLEEPHHAFSGNLP